MADRTTIDPDSSRRIFKNIEDIAGDLETALKNVETVRSTLDEPWGTDETGKRYAQGKEPNAIKTLGYVKDAVTYVRDLSAEGNKAVDEFENTNSEHGQGIAPE